MIIMGHEYKWGQPAGGNQQKERGKGKGAGGVMIKVSNKTH